MKTYIFIFLAVLNVSLYAQNVVFIENNGFVYSDTTSTPAVNIKTGEVIRSKDAKLLNKKITNFQFEKQAPKYWNLFDSQKFGDAIEPKKENLNEK